MATPTRIAKQVASYVSADVREKLLARAKKHNRSMANEVATIIHEALKRDEEAMAGARS